MNLTEPLAFTPWLRQQYSRRDVVGALARYLLDRHPATTNTVSGWLDWLEKRPVDELDDLLWWSFQAAERDYRGYREQEIASALSGALLDTQQERPDEKPRRYPSARARRAKAPRLAHGR